MDQNNILENKEIITDEDELELERIEDEYIKDIVDYFSQMNCIKDEDKKQLVESIKSKVFFKKVIIPIMFEVKKIWKNAEMYEFKRKILEKTKKFIWKSYLVAFKDSIVEIKEAIEKMPWPLKIWKKETNKWKLISGIKAIEKEIKIFNNSQNKNVLEIWRKINELLKLIPKNYNNWIKPLELSLETPPVRKKKIVQNVIIEVKNETSNIIDKLWSIEKRIENLENEILNENHLEEIEKILNNLNKISENPNITKEILEQIEIIDDKILVIILDSKNKKETTTTFSEESISKHNKEKEEIKEEKNFFTGSKYEEFLNFLLSESWFHYSLSSSKNPKDRNSKWDWSFSMKIARPIFYAIQEMLKKWIFNPENISWKEICEKYFETTEEKREEVYIFLKILENFDKSWNFFEIFKLFKEAVKKLADTNYYTKDNKENLRTILNFLEKVEENFIK